MFKPNYPDQIRTVQQLNIFMDYVVHGLIDEVSYLTEFHGVRTEEDYATKTVKIIIPIKVQENKVPCFSKDFANPIAEIVKELKYHCFCIIGLDICYDVGCLPVPKFEVHILSKEMEEKNMFRVPDVKKIIHQKSNRGEFFTVVWEDDTQTKVKLAEGDSSDEYTAFLYALGKRLFEDKGKAREFISEKKKIFEDEMARRKAEYRRHRDMLAMKQSLEHEDFESLEDEVYGEMFVAPALVSRKVFRRNR